MKDLGKFVKDLALEDPQNDATICGECKHRGNDFEDAPCVDCKIVPGKWEAVEDD